MDNYRFDRQESSTFKGTKRVVTAQAGPFTSLQLPVIVGNEQYKSVIDVGLPTSLISTVIWQKVNSPLYPIGENEIAERVTRRTNLQLMGYTHFQLQVGQTVLELEDALVYDYDEPEIFLSISAVAALGLIIDFQEGTFGLRSTDGLRCSWNEDTVLFPDNNLGNFSLLNKQLPSAGNYYDFTGSMNDSHHTSNLAYTSSGNMMGGLTKETTRSVSLGIDEMSVEIPGLGPFGYNQMETMLSSTPMDLCPIPPPVTMGPLDLYSMGFVHQGTKRSSNKRRKSVNFKKFKNFYLKSSRPTNNARPSAPINKTLSKIVNWKKDPSKEKIPGTDNRKITAGTTSNKNAAVKKSIVTPSKPSNKAASNAQSKMSKNQKRRAKLKLQAHTSPDLPKKKAEPTPPTINTNNKDTKGQKKLHCVNCHAKDHTMSNCRKPIALKCVYCGLTGHLRTNCPTVLKTSSVTSDAAVSNQTEPSAAEKNSPSISTGKIQAENETPSVTDPTALGKRPASSPENPVVKKRILNLDSEATTTQSNDPALTKSVIHEEVQQPNSNSENKSETDSVPKPSSVPFADQDDSFKKPELDLIVRVPVKRVVAKKNIKLNMLPKNTSSPTNPDTKEDEKNLTSSPNLEDISKDNKDSLMLEDATAESAENQEQFEVVTSA